jgi:hypothetical protein
MQRNHLKITTRRKNVVVDEQRDARLAYKRIHTDGMLPTASAQLRMHADMLPLIQKNTERVPTASECARMYDDIEPPILKNAERVETDGKPPTPRKGRSS